MPAFSTHYIFAKELLPEIQKVVDFKLNDNAVYFGSQGPDIFFFTRVFPWMPGKPLRSLGSALHRAKPSLIFESMSNYCREHSDDLISKSYAIGFIMHYALDRKCHPYIYAKQNEITKKSPLTNPHTAHNKIEFAMDALLIYKRLEINNHHKFNTADTVKFNDELVLSISNMLEYVLKQSINKDVKSKKIANAFKDTEQVQKLTFDPNGIKRILLTLPENIFAVFTKNYKITSFIRPKDLEKAKKYANIEHNLWVSPFDGNNRSHKSFEELFNEAKDDAITMIKEYINGRDCEQITQNISFLTGVEVK